MARPRGLYKRGTSWYARLWLGGKDRRVSLGKNYGRACDLLDKLKHGEDPVAQAVTVAEVGEQWIEKGLPFRRDDKLRRESGTQEAAGRFRALTGRFMGHLAIERVTPIHLRDFKRWLLVQRSKRTGKPYSQQTVRHVLMEASMLFKWAVEQGHIAQSPVYENLCPGVPKGRPRPYTPEQVELLLNLPDPHRWVIRLALATACRWSELCRIQASDLDGQWLTVQQTKTGTEKRVLIEPGLSQEIRRRVGLLVPYAPTSKSSFNRDVSRIVGFRFNTRRLRHTAASLWLSGGLRMEEVSENLGHASLKTTQTYAGLLEDARRNAMEAYLERTGTKTGTGGSLETL